MKQSNMFNNSSTVLDLSKYDSEQLFELNTAIDKGLDISHMLDTRLTSAQMYFIRLGLEEGVDVTIYNQQSNSVEFMAEKYRFLRREKAEKYWDETVGK